MSETPKKPKPLTWAERRDKLNAGADPELAQKSHDEVVAQRRAQARARRQDRNAT